MTPNTVKAIAALALCSSGAVAGIAINQQIDRGQYVVYDGQSQNLRGTVTSFYSDLNAGADGFVAFDDTEIQSDGELESAGVADYTSISSGDIVLNQFQFVGGIDQAGGVVFFDFFDAAGALIDGFGVQIAEAGNFIWTIDLNESITIANAGLIRMSIDDEDLAGAGSAAAGRWFLGNAGATIGDAGASEADPDFNFAFALNSTVPAPGSLALLGMGGIVMSRRKR